MNRNAVIAGQAGFSFAGFFFGQVALNLLLIPRMGLNGAALATLLLFLLLSALRLGEIQRLLKIHPFGKALWKPLAAGLSCGALLLVVRPWLLTLPPFAGLVTGAVLALSSYTLLMLLLKLEAEEREIILRYIPFFNKESKR